KMTRKSFPHRPERTTDVLGLIHTDLTPPYTPQHNEASERRNRTLLDMVRSMMNLTTLPLSFWDYALEAVARILNMVPTKKKSVGGREILKIIQDKDTSPSEITSKIPIEVEGFEPPQEEEAPVHPESNKWLDAMNAEMQSMKNNQVCRLVDLPPNGKTVGSKWLFKKRDGNVHTYKACPVAKGFTQTYRVDYKETFSPVADIKAIRILIAISAFYDYDIWKIDVKTAFLNGYLDEDI
nr:putative retrotransposon Ty1-copia subclass protein [Tanacetum cinerariifolium]